MTLTYSNQPRRLTFSPIRIRLVRRIWDTSTEICNRPKLRKELGSLGSHYLRDIGLTEQDVISARYYPLSCDAADKLNQMARLRSSNW